MKINPFIRILFCLALVLVTYSVSAQPGLAGTYWHDGEWFYPVEAEDDTAIWVNTLSLHEGGGAVPWLKTSKPDVFRFCHKNSHGITICDSVSRTVIDGQDLMIIYGADKKLENILIRYNGQSRDENYVYSHGFDSILEKDIRTRIKGKYTIPGTDLTWQITNDSIMVSGTSPHPVINNSTRYSVVWELDFPTPVLSLDNGNYLYYQFSLNGLDLFEGVLHTEEDGFKWVEKGRFVYHLYKQNQDGTVPGHWPEASTMILTRGYLGHYPPEVLRYMRNEIYARKGYRFDDDSLTSFFNQAGAWYQPSDQQENVQLSPIEKLNIQLIRFMEKEKKNRRFRSD